jgi:hypothetical protein
MAEDLEKEQMMDDFDDEDNLEFDDEEDLLGEEDDEELIPSVLYKGIAKPKTEDDWRQLLMEASREGVPEYRITDTYKDGDLILHPQFGLGVVSKVVSPRKMEVVFDMSKKLMAMNMTPPGEAAAS